MKNLEDMSYLELVELFQFLIAIIIFCVGLSLPYTVLSHYIDMNNLNLLTGLVNILYFFSVVVAVIVTIPTVFLGVVLYITRKDIKRACQQTVDFEKSLQDAKKD